MKRLHDIEVALEAKKVRSAWDKGVKLYAEELLFDLKEGIKGGYIDEDLACSNWKMFLKALLNGVDNWAQYSWGGCSFIYDYEIAERLCTPSELRKTDNGRKEPNKNEHWLDVQARALRQAAWMLWTVSREEGLTWQILQ